MVTRLRDMETYMTDSAMTVSPISIMDREDTGYRDRDMEDTGYRETETEIEIWRIEDTEAERIHDTEVEKGDR